MKFTISSSSNDRIDEKYKKSAKNLLNYLVSLENSELCWGSGSSSIMGLCYDAFSKSGKNIYGYTSSKYIDDIENLPLAKHRVFDTTFDLKKNIFNDADVVICLPGGTGTISEFFAYLEEIRSNDIDKLLVLYDENHHFKSTVDLINDLVERDFNSDTIHSYYEVAHDVDEFGDILSRYAKKKGKSK